MKYYAHKKIGIIGVGRMGKALIKGLTESKTIKETQIYIHDQFQKQKDKVVELYGVQSAASNDELVENCDIIFVCVKPQDLQETLSPVALIFDEHQTVISLAAGISLKTLQKTLPKVKNIVRIMPNTPIRIRKGVIGYCLSEKIESKDDSIIDDTIKDLLSPLGYVAKIEEGDEFEALTVGCASGPGFVYEIMLYWQDWLEEHGIEKEVSRAITIQTFLGTAMLALEDKDKSIQDLLDEVVSKKGVTAAGLESMRELEIERALRISFEKSVLRDRELGRDFK